MEITKFYYPLSSENPIPFVLDTKPRSFNFVGRDYKIATFPPSSNHIIDFFYKIEARFEKYLCIITEEARRFANYTEEFDKILFDVFSDFNFFKNKNYKILGVVSTFRSSNKIDMVLVNIKGIWILFSLADGIYVFGDLPESEKDSKSANSGKNISKDDLSRLIKKELEKSGIFTKLAKQKSKRMLVISD
jgi:hypothetical protein